MHNKRNYLLIGVLCHAFPSLLSAYTWKHLVGYLRTHFEPPVFLELSINAQASGQEDAKLTLQEQE